MIEKQEKRLFNKTREPTKEKQKLEIIFFNKKTKTKNK